MDLDVERQVQLRGAPQALAQDLFLDLELVVVGGVLVMTSAATGEVLTAWFDAMRGRVDDRV